MYKRSNPLGSFVGEYVDKRTRKSTFFKNINQIIDWNPIEKEINKVYKRGKNVVGQNAYSGLLLFKMLLIGQWYGLSDEHVEETVNDSLSAMSFCDLRVEDDVPDHSTLSRFRTELTEKKAFERLLRKLNDQLKKRGIMVKAGKAKVDASITDTERKPKGRKQYKVAEDRKEDEREIEDIETEEAAMKLVAVEQPGVDKEARWLKKRGKLHYGFKQHIAVDEDGMIEGVYTTTANEHDSKGLAKLLEKIPKAKREEIWADKGYKTSTNDELLKEYGIKNRIQDKAYRNRPLTEWQKLRNKLISKERYKVERTFGSIKKWFNGYKCRYVGIEKAHTQHLLQAIAHNLKRSPGLVMAKCIQ